MNPLTLLLFSTLLYLSLAFSESLTNWFKQIPPKNREMYDIIYVKNVFTVVGDKGFIMRSYDGENWDVVSPPNDFSLLGITYGKGRYVAVGDNGRVRISEDGEHWKKFNIGVEKLFMDVAYGNSVFVAVGVDGSIVYSYDGITWERAISNTVETLFRVKYINSLGKFFITGEDSTLLVSEDGIKWDRVDINLSLSPHFISIAYGKGRFVITSVGGKVFVSQDLENWTEKRIIPSGVGRGRYLLDVIYAFDRFIVVGQYGVIALSKDGENWEYIRNDDSKFLMSIAKGTNFLIAVGLNGAVYKSETVEQEIDYPKIEVSPKSVDFGTVLLGQNKQVFFEIKNTGRGKLLIDRIFISGDNKSDFSLENNSCFELEVNEICLVGVVFSPFSEGLKNAFVRISSNDISTPIVSIPIHGIGALSSEPKISIDRDKIKVENIFPGDKTSVDIIVKNIGYSDLLIEDIMKDGDFFTYRSNCENVKPFESCYIKLLFSPENSGEFHGRIIIKSNDTEKPEILIPVTAIVNSPKEYPKVIPHVVDFGEVNVGSKIKRKILIKNTGNKTFYSLSVNLNNSSTFSQTNNCDGINLERDMECEIYVYFQPSEIKEYNQYIDLSYRVETSTLPGIEKITQKNVQVKLYGKGIVVKDSSFFKGVNVSVKNGRIAQNPEEFTNVKLPDRYTVLNGLSFRYSIILEKNIDIAEVSLELPFKFLKEKMKIFKCTDEECTDITDNVNINGKNISFSIVDGGDLDGDREKNGIIEDPIVIAQIKESTDNTSNDKSTSSGGGGCKLSKHYELSLLVVIIGFLLFRRLGRSR